jgi:regulator of sigma E protease
MISISLGALNLLPIPVLDGGHLVYYAFEAIMGRPVSDRALAVGQRIGLAMLLCFMSIALFNDASSLFG